MITSKKIKIHYQFATAKGKTQGGNVEIKKRENFISKYLSKDTSVKLSVPNKGPGSIETEYDEAIAIPNVIKGIIYTVKMFRFQIVDNILFGFWWRKSRNCF